MEVEHAMLEVFRQGDYDFNEILRNIIDVKNDLFYLFHISTGNILVTSTSFIYEKEHGGRQRYQVFVPRVHIEGDARLLTASEDNDKVAVVTNVGLYIVHLPHVWTCLMKPSAPANGTPCKAWMVRPDVSGLCRSFVHQVLQVRWHPWALNKLVILYNDNFLRLLDTEFEVNVCVLSLGRHPVSSLSTAIPLRETAVDFDFLLSKHKVNHVASGVEDRKSYVLVLYKNADIATAILTKDILTRLRPMNMLTERPVDMPASRLIVMSCYPTVVVMAFETGFVYHSLLMISRDKQSLQEFERYDVFNGVAPTEETTPIILLKDPGLIYRYFVVYPDGIIAVMLPLIPALESFVSKTFAEDTERKLYESLENCHGIVKQLVSTHLPCMSSPIPIFGVGLVPGRVVMCRAVVLHGDTAATVHSVDPVFPPVSTILSKRGGEDRSIPKEDFLTIINDYLFGDKTYKRPFLLRLGDSVENNSPVEVLKAVQNYITYLKEERVKKHFVVAEILETKALDIAIEHAYQVKECEHLKSDKELLKLNAERIAEKYEERNDKLMELQKRIETIGLKISEPSRSIAEDKVKTELEQLKKRTDELNTVLQQSRAACHYIELEEVELSNLPNQPENRREPLHLNETIKKAIKQAVMEMNESIRLMKKRMNHLQSQMNFLSD